MFVRNLDGGVHAVDDNFPVPEGWAVITDPGPDLAPEDAAPAPVAEPVTAADAEAPVVPDQTPEAVTGEAVAAAGVVPEVDPNAGN
jgi:hypothetical protein